MRDHPDARMACIETGRSVRPDGPLIDHFALIEGLPDRAIGELLLAWDHTYGLPATFANGSSLAVRLPLPVSRLGPEVIARLKALDLGSGTPVGHVLQGPYCDLWIACGTADAAARVADDARLQLPVAVGALISIGEPSVADQECWAALRLADEVAQGSA